MRTFRPLVVPVILLLLAAQSLPALWQMHCRDMERFTLQWFSAKSCCAHGAPERDGTTVERTCCTYVEVQAALDVQHRTAPTTVPEGGRAVVFEHPAHLVPPPVLAVPEKVPHKPPPRGDVVGRLSQLGVFRL